ncbi:hypothetical protein GGR02_001700 [Anoxybacillus voinovskiensis]|uniref:DUF2515 domain-containing protein n=1 Tax=Anoxybacteroides voinovskiense TaxID=230470 RepID=A0A840DUC6_9BACL|nr:DUF2515 domain-containing protein [Anoxybacillus voinovskiensis]MBB4073937.1 hypothetical protein [Anoxybacillus voinovskiensis]GGJ66003.1 hypothetical protein GCM10008982_14060 [Anoxybacillus voinovskiensis]
MNAFVRLFATLSHPIQSLYRHWLYRQSISISSSAMLQKLFQEETLVKPLTNDERKLVMAIKNETTRLNRDNITRTEAYFSFFQRHPEIHWAFLAHLVSRNGGWNMTDLKGSLVPVVVATEQIKPLFLFLERANALIFHDAYPQLLLYEKSKEQKKKLFHLLPSFSVSAFMRPFWEHFYETNDAPLLTVALIINEQQYIQHRVVQHPFFQEQVVKTFPFLCQQWLGFNDVLIPYKNGRRVRLTGITVRDFADVSHRIEIGKALYGMLFYRNSLFQRVYHFACQTKHTGSRADFWPHIFSATNDGVRIFSPTLNDAWPVIEHRFPDKHDWFYDLTILRAAETIPLMSHPSLTAHYVDNLKKLQKIATAAKQATHS